jgi:hypothetical protein
MPGHFENGVWVEEDNTDAAIAANALNAGMQYFRNWNTKNSQQAGVVWAQATDGTLVVCTPDPKYAEKLKRFVGRLK